MCYLEKTECAKFQNSDCYVVCRKISTRDGLRLLKLQVLRCTMKDTVILHEMLPLKLTSVNTKSTDERKYKSLTEWL